MKTVLACVLLAEIGFIPAFIFLSGLKCLFEKLIGRKSTDKK